MPDYRSPRKYRFTFGLFLCNEKRKLIKKRNNTNVPMAVFLFEGFVSGNEFKNLELD